MNRRIELRARTLVFTILCLAAIGGLVACASASIDEEARDDPTGESISGANVYDASLTLEYTFGNPTGDRGIYIGLALTGCSHAKTVPAFIAGGYSGLIAQGAERVSKYCSDEGVLSDGFEYMTVRLSVENLSDETLLMYYGLGAIVSGEADRDDDPTSFSSREPVWCDLDAGKKNKKQYWHGTIGARERQDVTLVYIVSDKLLQTEDGPYLLFDGGAAKKALRLDADGTA